MPALTVSFTLLSTGTDSPVRADSLMELSPEIITPSTGILSPGFTTKISSNFTPSILMIVSIPSRMTVAFLGANFIKLFNASVVLPLDFASNILPIVMNTSIIAADSKYN